AADLGGAEGRPERTGNRDRRRAGREGQADRPAGVDQRRRDGRDLMSGFALTVGATVMCSHAGQAQPTVPSPRVQVGGQPVLTQSSPDMVAGCSLSSLPSPPCVTGQFLTGPLRVMVGGTPLLLQDSQSICTPTGAPLMVVMTQLRVKAS